MLGLSTRAVTEDMVGWQQDATGFIIRDDQGRRGGQSGLEKSPVNFMKVLMSKIRKNGDSIVKTHMGQLLEGKLLQQSDFEFPVQSQRRSVISKRQSEEGLETRECLISHLFLIPSLGFRSIELLALLMSSTAGQSWLGPAPEPRQEQTSFHPT
ncbi:hypothetical protein BST61_g3480 [Cercospora zeina]